MTVSLASLPAGPGPIVADRRDGADRIEIRGADRARFLNGLVTAAIKDLADGDGAFGFLTARKGGTLADFALLALDDRFWLELPPGRAAALQPHLELYVLADRVEMAPLDRATVAVLGPEAEAALRPLVGDLPTVPWSHRAGELLGRPVRLQRHAGFGVPAWQIWTSAVDFEPWLDGLRAATQGRPPVADELEVLRVLAGWPRWGQDYREDSFPQETGLEEGISYTKGCYLGQEIVARIHYRGGIQRALVGLRLSTPVAAGTELAFEGRPVGALGTVVHAPALGTIALALVHRRGAEPGTRLSLPEGASADVVPLPFGISGPAPDAEAPHPVSQEGP